MKIKKGFVLRTMAGETVALPSDGVTRLDMMITLNDTGRFLWERLQQDTSEDALVEALLGEYEVDEPTARESVVAFVQKLKELDFLG